MAPGLLNMPQVVMTKIIEDIGFRTMMTLRKVCHDLRNFVDDVKPDAKLEEIWVFVENPKIISVRYHFSGCDFCVKYIQHREGCLVKCNYGRSMVLLKNEDFIAVSMKDFEIVLRHQKSVLNVFGVIGKYKNKNIDVILSEYFERIFKSRVHPLKTKKFSADHINQNQIMIVLPFLNSKILSNLSISSYGENLEVDQLVQLDQWKNIEHMNLNGCVDYKYIQHFTHFAIGYVCFKTTNCPDLASLKNLFLQSSGFQYIQIIPTNYDSNYVERYIELFGEPFIEVISAERRWNKWFYRIPATTKVLEIRIRVDFLSKQMDIKLSKIEEDDVPQNAVIHN